MSTARFQVTCRASMLVRVAVQDRGVEDRREQVVGGADRVDVAGEVEVEVLHRHHLGEAAAGRAALHPEHRAERRLAQAEHRAAADVAEALGERDRGRRLALARLRRGHPGDADQLAVRPVGQPVDRRQRDLALVAAVGLDLLGLEADPLADLVDRQELGLLRDLEAAASSSAFLPWSVNVRRPPPRSRRPGGRGRSARARTARSARACCRWRSAPRSSCRRSAPP